MQKPLLITRRTVLSVVATLLIVCASGLSSSAQFQTERYSLTPDEASQLADRCSAVRTSLIALKEQSSKTNTPRADQIPDAEIYLDGVERNLKQKLFFSKQQVKTAFNLLDEANVRIQSLKSGEAPWLKKPGVIVLGYRSAIDGSAQPYQAFIPTEYDPASKSKLRLDIFLHGRGGNLNEITFLQSTGWLRGNFGSSSRSNFALYPYGRGNNGWRFAGEQDVFEALADFKHRFPVDDNGTTLRGFSMGGHGVFHIGLHYPGLWASASPGAGFVDTINYMGIKEPLPAWQLPLLHLYDAVDYAANASNLPWIDYVGDQDPKLPQYQLMTAALQHEGVTFRDIVVPKIGHRYEAEALKSIVQDMDATVRAPASPTIRFVTYTLRHPECKWIRVEGLETHWQRAEVNAKLVGGTASVHTRNVSALTIHPPDGGIALTIDDQTIHISGAASLIKSDGKWRIGKQGGLRKRPGLQGPIDDAIFGPVLVVNGSSTPWSPSMTNWLTQEQARFRNSWSYYFRGALPEKTDSEITRVDIKDHNLYLFGDPGSNAILRRILPKLPLKWTRDSISIAGKTYSTSDHLPMLIFPNPENPDRYVVINSGMTFSRADMDGSNALQYPHLPDYAVIRYDPASFTDNRTKDTEIAGYFDEKWQTTTAH